jgi:hypothetical protein
MLRINLLVVFSSFLLQLTELRAQVFSLQPGPVHEGVLPLDAYSIHKIDMVNLTGTELNLSWRLVENSCPHDWYIGLCDYNSCYGMLPQNGDMLPVSGDITGFIKLDVNPWLVEGAGTLHFWVYETGNFEDRVDIYFHLSTAGFTSVGPSAIDLPRFSIEPVAGNLVVTGSSGNDRILLHGLNGALLAEWRCEGLPKEYFPIPFRGYFVAGVVRGNQRSSGSVLLINPQ